MSLVIDEHRQYLADRPRIDAFRRALAEVISPGDVVIDIGSGTGIMALLACAAGAKRVYSIEETSMIEVAREIVAANGVSDRVVFVKGHSAQVSLPEKADVLVGDQIGRFGFEAGVLDLYADARERLLAPGARTVPSCIDLCVAPVEAPEMFAWVEFWSTSPAGFDLRSVRSRAANTGYPVKFRPGQLLGEAGTVASLELASVTTSPFEGTVACRVGRAGTVHGIAGWFCAQLSAGARLTNSPLSGDAIDRRQVYFPLEQPLAVKEGDTVHVSVHVRPADVTVTWRAWIDGAKDAPGLQSTFRGMLVCREDLERTRPDYTPRLNPRGEARRTVVNLCDGARRLAEIEREVFERHRALFRSPADAAAFVAEVVVAYSL